MYADELLALRGLLNAQSVTLVQPVVRDGTLLVGQCQTVDGAGVQVARDVGRALGGVVGSSHAEDLLERYHEGGGGVVGVAPPGTEHKAPEGLHPLDGPHLLGWTAPEHHPNAGVWLVLDGHTLGFVHVTGKRLQRRARTDALELLVALRRKLSRGLDSATYALTGTGFALLGEDRTPEATDRRAAAFAEAQGRAAWRTGVAGGALVVARTLEGRADTRLATVRPIRAPEAPVGLMLTTAQRRIARLLASSATVDEIAADRGCSPSTVQRHRDDIYRVLGVSRRTELMERLRRV